MLENSRLKKKSAAGLNIFSLTTTAGQRIYTVQEELVLLKKSV